MVFFTAKRIFFLFSVVEIFYWQGAVSGTIRRRCETGCVTPRRCISGYFDQSTYMRHPYDYCCEENEHVGYSNENIFKLDCRYRDQRNFYKTKIPANVESLDLTFTSIFDKTPQLRDEFLQQMENLKYLTISSAMITSLPSNFLSNNPALKHLDLSYNRIKELPESLFEYNTALVVVDLSDNSITSLPRNLFQYNGNIEILNLKKNGLKRLTEYTFRHLPKLQDLDVSVNKLDCINGEVFANNPRLEILDLRNNGNRVYRGLQNRFCKRLDKYDQNCQKFWHFQMKLRMNTRMHAARGHHCSGA